MIPLLTFRGFLLLGFLLVFGPSAGLFLGSGWQAGIATSMIGILLLILVLVSEYFSLNRMRKQLEITAELPDQLYSGIRTAIVFTVRWPALTTSLSGVLRPPLFEGVKVEAAEHKVVVAKNGDAPRLAHFITCLHRGEIHLGHVYLRVCFPQRLVTWQWEHALVAKVTARVYPSPFSQPERGQRAIQMLTLGETPYEYAGGEGREFDCLRRYALGDDLRRVDWKRSAKRTSFVVKVYRPETHQRVYLILDCSRRMNTQVGERLQLDYAADAAAYLIHIATESDDEVGLFAFDHRILTSVPARRGRLQRKLLMQEMMKLEGGTLEGDYELVKQWGLSCSRRSLFVVLTSISNPASVEVIGKVMQTLSQKHLPLVVAVYDRELEQAVNVPVVSVEGAFIQAAAFEQREAINSRINALRRKGIECVYSDVLDVGAILRKKYFQLKLSGRL